jgi:hypothetical protein
MRTACTFIRQHGRSNFELIAGPDVPIARQLTEFKKVLPLKEHPSIAEAQLWYSDHGRSKVHRMADPKAKKPKAKAVEPAPADPPKETPPPATPTTPAPETGADPKTDPSAKTKRPR